jgi:hypothetical protein
MTGRYFLYKIRFMKYYSVVFLSGVARNDIEEALKLPGSEFGGTHVKEQPFFVRRSYGIADNDGGLWKWIK